MLEQIPVDAIHPSPYQHRKHFGEAKLNELAKSIERDGLIEPIVVRRNASGYELIAGERRWRAARRASLPTILSRIVEATDLQARRMCAAENMQRQDLSDVEAVFAITELIDAEMADDDTYLLVEGDTPIRRVDWLLGKLKADYNNGTNHFMNKFVHKVERIFDSLPRPKEWLSFYNHDFRPLIAIDDDVKETAIANQLNKSQTKALDALKKEAPAAFQELTRKTDADGRVVVEEALPFDPAEEVTQLRDMSANDIRRAAWSPLRSAPPMYLPDRRTPPLPTGKYRCLVVDPPWEIEKIARDVRPNQVEMDYPMMGLDELRVFPIPDLAADDCHLYLWTTHKYLPAALELAQAWGFTYQCLMTWRKNVGFTPFSWMYSTEHVLFCRRGSLDLLKLGLRLDFEAPVREHSRKPDVFYDLVRQASPGPRIDMFAREPHEGFDTWGNEVERFVAEAV